MSKEADFPPFKQRKEIKITFHDKGTKHLDTWDKSVEVFLASEDDTIEQLISRAESVVEKYKK